MTGARGREWPADDGPVCVDIDIVRDESCRECADVLYGTGSAAYATELLSRYPGCLLVTLRGANGVCLTVTRGCPLESIPDDSVGARRQHRTVLGPVPGPVVTSAEEHRRFTFTVHAWFTRLTGRPRVAAGDPPGDGRPSG